MSTLRCWKTGQHSPIPTPIPMESGGAEGAGRKGKLHLPCMQTVFLAPVCESPEVIVLLGALSLVHEWEESADLIWSSSHEACVALSVPRPT